VDSNPPSNYVANGVYRKFTEEQELTISSHIEVRNASGMADQSEFKVAFLGFVAITIFPIFIFMASDTNDVKRLIRVSIDRSTRLLVAYR